MSFNLGPALTRLHEQLGYDDFESLSSDYLITLFTREEFIERYLRDDVEWTIITDQLFNSLSVEIQNGYIREHHLKMEMDSMSIVSIVYVPDNDINFVIVARRAV